MTQWKRVKSAVNWREFVATTFIDATKPLVAEALDLLENGDVSSTQYGIRVENTDTEWCLGQPRPYWPKLKGPYCRCYTCRAYGDCRHLWAAHIYELWRDSEAADTGTSAEVVGDAAARSVSGIEDWFRMPRKIVGGGRADQ